MLEMIRNTNIENYNLFRISLQQRCDHTTTQIPTSTRDKIPHRDYERTDYGRESAVGSEAPKFLLL
jgi:hypothetical protein